MNVWITLERAAASFDGGATAVPSPVSLELCAGDVVIVTGDNGTGKTTLLDILYGSVPLCTGTRTPSTQWKSSVVRIYQQNGLVGSISALANCKLAGANEGAIVKWTDRLDLTSLSNRNGAQMSGGEQKLIQFIRAAVSGKEVWLLDEGTSEVDDKRTQIVLEGLEVHTKNGGTVVFATHDGRVLEWSDSLKRANVRVRALRLPNRQKSSGSPGAIGQ